MTKTSHTSSRRSTTPAVYRATTRRARPPEDNAISWSDQLDPLPHEVTKIAVPKLGIPRGEGPVGVERITDEAVVGTVVVDDRDVRGKGPFFWSSAFLHPC